MFKDLSNKRKLIFLGIGFLIFFFLTYKLALKRTIQLHQQCAEIEEQLEQLENAPKQIALIQSKLDKIDQKAGGKQITQINLEELIMEQISGFCKKNNLVLKEYPGIHQLKQQEYLTETCKLTIEGSFIKLLKLAHEIERDFSFGKVASLNFYSQKNFKTKKKELLLEIYVQNIKMVNHE